MYQVFGFWRHTVYSLLCMFRSFVRATAECFGCLSHRIGVCPSVYHTLDLYKKRCKLELQNFHYWLPNYSSF